MAGAFVVKFTRRTATGEGINGGVSEGTNGDVNEGISRLLKYVSEWKAFFMKIPGGKRYQARQSNQ